MSKTVCNKKIQNLDHLRQRIADAVTSVKPDIVQRTSAEVDYGLYVCKANNGEHIKTQ